MKERDFQTMWHHYLEAHPPYEPEVYELKLCKTERFEFSRLKQHQIDGLMKSMDGMFYKISDAPIFSGMKTRFNTKKPYDCLWIKSNAYVCIMYYIPRRRKQVVKVPITYFESVRRMHPKKSISFSEWLTYKNHLPIVTINFNREA